MNFFADLTPVIFHPGDSGIIPGNTLESVLAAKDIWREMGAYIRPTIECDFRQLPDGTIIVCRYPKLKIAGIEHDWADIDQHNIRNANATQFLSNESDSDLFYEIPTLQTFADAVFRNNFSLIAEIKVDPNESPEQKEYHTKNIITELRKCGFSPLNCLITSFDPTVLQAVCHYPQRYMRGLMVTEPDITEILFLSQSARLSSIHIQEDKLTPALASALQQDGLMIFPFVVNDAERAKELLAFPGVKSVLSDAPGQILPQVAAMRPGLRLDSKLQLK